MGSKNKRYRGAPPQFKANMKFVDRNNQMVMRLISDALEEGQQRIIDMVECVLHDSSFMGHSTMGPEKVKAFIQEVAKRDRYYDDAFLTNVESDVKQEELDRELKEIHGEKLVPFKDRHPSVMMLGYDKKRKGWVDE